MIATTVAHDHLSELIELKAATDEMFAEARYAASIHKVQICAVNTEALFKPYIDESTANKPTTGTTP
ncbi:hypothetical protein [Pseudoduganella danionis]|uniref:hypothetical protein n=1 Tax=Pseudoduganella danionis TaxID=1890295 RepID=UPI0035B4AAD7